MSHREGRKPLPTQEGVMAYREVLVFGDNPEKQLREHSWRMGEMLDEAPKDAEYVKTPVIAYELRPNLLGRKRARKGFKDDFDFRWIRERARRKTMAIQKFFSEILASGTPKAIALAKIAKESFPKFPGWQETILKSPEDFVNMAADLMVAPDAFVIENKWHEPKGKDKRALSRYLALFRRSLDKAPQNTRLTLLTCNADPGLLPEAVLTGKMI